MASKYICMIEYLVVNKINYREIVFIKRYHVTHISYHYRFNILLKHSLMHCNNCDRYNPFVTSSLTPCNNCGNCILS